MLIILLFSQLISIFISLFIVSVASIMQIIILSSILSSIFTFTYLLLHAPDIAITEASINVTISSVLYIFAYLYIKNLQIFSENNLNNNTNINLYKTARKKIIIFILFILFSSVLSILILHLPSDFLHGTNYMAMTEYYVKNMPKDFGFDSIVTAIIAGYRAFDTLFECVVIFIASIGFKTILSDSKI